MISTDMYHILASIPKTPDDTNINKVREKTNIHAWTLKVLLELAVEKKYIKMRNGISNSDIANPTISFFITEDGAVAREEYETLQLKKENASQSLQIAKKAYKVSIISIFLSALAIVVSALIA